MGHLPKYEEPDGISALSLIVNTQRQATLQLKVQPYNPALAGLQCPLGASSAVKVEGQISAFFLNSAVQQIGDRVILGLIFALSSLPFMQSPAAGGEVQSHLVQAADILVLLLFQCMILWCAELS